MTRRRAGFAALLLLAGCSGGSPAPPPPPPAPPSSLRSPPAVLPAPGTDAIRVPGRTVFLPHRAAAFDPARENGLWCASFSMAWGALGREVLKGPPLFGPPAPEAFVAGMNARPFPLDALDPAACIAVAGIVADGILDRIRAEGRRKFDLDLPRADLGALDPESILAYAFLRKELPFEHPFETFPDGIPFAGAKEPVRAFGLSQEGENLRRPEIASQVAVLFDNGEAESREFGLRVSLRGGGDELLLFLVRPGGTLDATWGMADARRAEVPGPLAPSAILGIPKIHFSLEHEFAELHGAHARNPGFERFFVDRAWQSVLFRMDETGLRVESEAGMGLELGEAEPPPTYLFDRPFLVALRQAGAEEPYLLLWVANPDLMPE